MPELNTFMGALVGPVMAGLVPKPVEARKLVQPACTPCRFVWMTSRNNDTSNTEEVAVVVVQW